MWAGVFAIVRSCLCRQRYNTIQINPCTASFRSRLIGKNILLFVQFDGPHHVVVFVIQNMAMPHIARPRGGVEGEFPVSATLGSPLEHEAGDMVRERDDGVFPSDLVGRWPNGWASKAALRAMVGVVELSAAT